jgi:monoamine oxidase
MSNRWPVDREDSGEIREDDQLLETGQPSPAAQPRMGGETLATPSEGLEPRAQVQKRVIIVGGGIAGLVAGFELLRQGHEPLILEAQHRVGGRVYTMRDFAPGLYIEAGAMRIPRVHDLTLEYCRLFGLELRPFVMRNPHTLVHLAGQAMTMEEASREPERLPFELAEHERGRTWEEMWADAVRDVVALFEQEGESAWDRIYADYDQYSIQEYLELKGFSPGAIELYGVMSFREQNMEAAVVEQFREILGRAFENMQEIVGGTDLLPRAFYRQMPHHVRFGAVVTALEQDEHSVTVHFKTRSGRFSVPGDFAIVTVPFPVLRDIEVRPALSREKQRAIRELNYNASTKIVFQTKSRFWEREPYGIVGGTTATDLPIRRIVYPSFSDPEEERGMLLASYTWAQDALRWGSMGEGERIEQALEDVAKIHPEIVEEFEVGASHAWYSDPFAGGAFALFEPGQQSRLQSAITRTEGRIHFAGEHCSLWHAWIQGALESGIRAAREIHEAPAAMTPELDKA